MPFFPYRHEFYPVNNATQAKDGPNEVSDSTLESGGGGEFFGMIFWDAAVICVVLWHVNIMKLRGVWGKRKDNETQTKKRVEREEKKLTPEDKALLQVSGTPKIAICLLLTPSMFLLCYALGEVDRGGNGHARIDHLQEEEGGRGG